MHVVGNGFGTRLPLLGGAGNITTRHLNATSLFVSEITHNNNMSAIKY